MEYFDKFVQPTGEVDMRDTQSGYQTTADVKVIIATILGDD